MTPETLDQDVDRSPETLAKRRQALADKGITNGADKPARAERSDKGSTRGPFVDIDDGAVRFDLSKEAGRTAFKAWAQLSDIHTRLGLDHAIAAITSLLKKHGAQAN